MMDLPDDLPVIERNAVRLVVLDVENCVLLFHIHEPMDPDQSNCWELPGGGIDSGEDHVMAALRELREESGILVQPGDVGPATWNRQATFRHAGERRLQHEVVVLVRLNQRGPQVDESGQLQDEQDTYLGARWWPVAEIESSTERFYPGQLPVLLRRFLDGELIDEPFEYFS